eukprot:1182033-Prorocentrum_minimum.AAC.2
MAETMFAAAACKHSSSSRAHGCALILLSFFAASRNSSLVQSSAATCAPNQGPMLKHEKTRALPHARARRRRGLARPASQLPYKLTPFCKGRVVRSSSQHLNSSLLVQQPILPNPTTESGSCGFESP